MKKFLVLILICFASNVFSQSKDDETIISDDENKVYNTAGIDIVPEFPGGINEFYKFIGKNYIVPKEKPVFVKGKVYIAFIIEKDGSLNDIKLLKDVGFGTGNEAIRVLKLCPKWTPGKLKGKEVRVLYSLPLVID
ncbi:energy transducer TonB [Flavobacterium geliluteum]|uniref:Energy transducer TonB n=1 Tax=Flavobacterium geliluteum TaxID=2816120 RepID=A0A940X8A0_9FLAO|nr:energy transducer TonB [Flavobacterium geliluteum]MBP4138285.1 energy transducer TonB [Flavobacterium geliluteum]